MPKITLTVNVKAPIENVFDILDDPQLTPLYANKVLESYSPKRTHRHIGDVIVAKFKFLGIGVTSRFVTKAYKRPTLLRTVADGRLIKVDMTFRLKKTAKGTTITNSAVYAFGKMGQNVFQYPAMNALLGRSLKQSMHDVLQGVKQMAEAGFVRHKKGF